MKKYQYRALEIPRQIRILRLYAGKDTDELSGELVHTSLEDAPDFIALSYAWGTSDTRATFCCSNSKLEIGPSLHSALHHLRQPDSETLLWADAICINQEDFAERREQVKIMSEIYALALCTTIWLGEGSDEIRMAFGWLRRFAEAEEELKELDQPVSRDNETFITTQRAEQMVEMAFGKYRDKAFQHIWVLLDCLWFTRKWVIQELVKSQWPILVAGRKGIHWKLAASWLRVVERCPRLKEKFMQFWPQPEEAVDGKVLGTSMLRFTLLTRITVQEEQTLMFLLVRTLEFRCLDPRDHVFAIVGIASDSDGFVDLIEYEIPMEELCQQLAYSCVCDSVRLKLLWSLGFFTPLERRVLSWVPDIEAVLAEREGGILATMFTAQQYRYYNASGNSVLQTSLIGNLLNIRGRIIDKVQLLGSDKRRLGDACIVQSIPYSNAYLWWKNLQGMTRQRHLWMEECLAVTRQMKIANYEEAFEDALLGDSGPNQEARESLAVARRELPDMKRLYRIMAYEKDYRRWLSAAKETHSMKSDFLLNSMILEKLHRRFGGTEDKKIGWFPLMAEVGDLICIFDGMELPYVIRPAEEGRFSLIGECILPGLMMGEAMACTHVESSAIVLT